MCSLSHGRAPSPRLGSTLTPSRLARRHVQRVYPGSAMGCRDSRPHPSARSRPPGFPSARQREPLETQTNMPSLRDLICTDLYKCPHNLRWPILNGQVKYPAPAFNISLIISNVSNFRSRRRRCVQPGRGRCLEVCARLHHPSHNLNMLYAWRSAPKLVNVVSASKCPFCAST